MKTTPLNVVKLIVPFILFFVLLACSKDSDVLAGHVLSEENASNDKDLAVDDFFTISGKQPLILDVLSNDTFIDPENVKIVNVTDPPGGTVTINENMTLTYVPEGDTTKAETSSSEVASTEPAPTETSTSETASANDPSTEATTEEKTKSSDTSSPKTSEAEPSDPSDETDTFTYTTETVNDDNTVSTEEGTVTVKKSGDNNGTEGDAIVLGTLKAFPSAQGHGADVVTGGKGGKIFYVNDLSYNSNGSYDAATDTHTGSFRYCLTHPDAGYLVFRVSGVIPSGGGYKFNTLNGHKTIMGGTAPYPGVFYYGDRFQISDKNSGDVGEQWIFRGITWMVGTRNSGEDSFMMQGAEKVIFSDNTTGWGADESFSIKDSDNFIAQRNFAFESEPGHNTGSLMSTPVATPGGNRKGSFHNNGYVHVDKRFPNLRGLDTDNFDVINQFAYNMQGQMGSHMFGLRLNDINNYYVPGSQTTNPKSKWNAFRTKENIPFAAPLFYSKGNIIEGRFDDPNADNSVLWVQHITAHGFKKDDPLPASWFTDNMFSVGLDIQIKTARKAFEYNIVGKNIGARFYMDESGLRQKFIVPFIDAYYEDAINHTHTAYRNDRSRFVLPGLPDSGTAYADTDHDGMADAWETMHGLKVGVDDKEGVKKNWTIDGANFANEAGFTNIQMFDDYVHGGLLILIDQQK